MERLLRKSVTVLMALALAFSAWGRLPVQPVAAEACSTLGDYRSAATGNWDTTATWEYCDGSNWVAASSTPTSANGAISIRNGHTVTVTVAVTVDQVTIEAGGQVSINSGITWTIADGTGVDLVINGIVENKGTFSPSASSTWTLNSGATFIHNTTTGISTPLTRGTLDPASTFIYRGSSTLRPAVSMSGKTYGNLIFESTSGTWSTTSLSGSTATSIKGNFTLGTGVTINMGTFVGLIVGGNWTNNGTFTASNSFVIFNGTAEQTIGGSSATTFNNLTINTGATVVVPTTVAVNGTLTNNGALKQTRAVSSGTVSFLNISSTKYYGVDITPQGDMGDTTVTVWGNQACAGTQNTVMRCFDISPTTSQQAEITLYYRDAEANSQTAPNIWHFSGGNWVQASGITRGGSGEGNWVKGTVTTFSPFTLSDNDPTAVDLTDFSAVWDSEAVTVTWETAQELDNLGFNLYRGESAAGPWVKLNAELIPTRNPGAVFGATYTWLDEGVTPGATYFYRLEDVDIYGVSTFHGPVSTAPVDPSAVALTAFGARGPAFGLPLVLAALGLWGLARKRRS